MAQVEIPEKYAADLSELAKRDQRAVQDVLAEAIDSYLSFRWVEAELSAEQIAKVRLGLEAAERGEVVSQEEVEAFFEDWEKDISSR